MTLFEKLIELKNSDMLPLHMPGHKRRYPKGLNPDIYGIDITEIDGFDDLHAPDGIIQSMMDKAAKIYGAGSAYISVGGSTAANEAAILACCNPGDRIIMSRACHKSVYYAVEIGNLIPEYIGIKTVEETDIVAPVQAIQIERAFDKVPDARCVVITSPTYEGLVADIGAIAEVVHAHNAILIVDCAHGAHFGLSDVTEANPISLGADIVIESLHKTLPSPTQTALLLVSDCIDKEINLQHYMSVFQSSSPSYILMAGIGECLEYMEKDAGMDLELLHKRVMAFKEELVNLKHLDVNPIAEAEFGKLIIRCVQNTNIKYSGRDLYDELKDTYHIQCEMCGLDYALAMLSVMDGDETFSRLAMALREIDNRLDIKVTESNISVEKNSTNFETQIHSSKDAALHMSLPAPQVVYTSSDAIRRKSILREVDSRAIGCIAANYVCAYPPGIPIVVPGERIDKEVIQYITNGLENGLNIVGLENNLISVLE